MNACKRYPLLFVVAWATLSSAAASGAEDVESGLRCLYVASVAMGNEAEFDQLRQIAPTPAASHAHSLTQLRDLAEAMGYKTLLTTTDFEQLQARSQRQRFACIAWLRERNFVLLADFKDGQVLVVDPPRKHWSDPLVLRQIWDGQALLLSTDPLLDEDGLHQLSWTKLATICVGITVAIAGSSFAFWKKRS